MRNITKEDLQEMLEWLDETQEETENRLHGEAEGIDPEEEEFSEETEMFTVALMAVALFSAMILLAVLFGVLP